MKGSSKKAKSSSKAMEMAHGGECECGCQDCGCECGCDDCGSDCGCYYSFGEHFAEKCAPVLALGGIILVVVGSGMVALPAYINGWTVIGLFMFLAGGVAASYGR